MRADVLLINGQFFFTSPVESQFFLDEKGQVWFHKYMGDFSNTLLKLIGGIGLLAVLAIFANLWLIKWNERKQIGRQRRRRSHNG